MNEIKAKRQFLYLGIRMSDDPKQSKNQRKRPNRHLSLLVRQPLRPENIWLRKTITPYSQMHQIFGIEDPNSFRIFVKKTTSQI